MSPKKARKILKISGLVLSILLFVFFLVSLIAKIFNPSFLIVGIFVMFSTLFPDNCSKYERLYRVGYRLEKLKRGLEVKEIAVPYDMSVQQAYSLLNSDKFTCFVLVDEKLHPGSIIPETLIEKYYDKNVTLYDIASKM
jgi:hypothetical protein